MFVRLIAIFAFTVAATATVGTHSAAGGGCLPANVSTSGTGITVDIRNCGFSPTILRAPLGATVTFTNGDHLPHVISGVGWGNLSYTGGMLNPGMSETHSFAEAGVYPYMCYLHPGMAGAIIVGDATSAGTPRSVPVAASAYPSPSAAPVVPATPRTTTAPTEPTSAPAVPLIFVLSLVVMAVAGAAGYALARYRRR